MSNRNWVIMIAVLVVLGLAWTGHLPIIMGRLAIGLGEGIMAFITPLIVPVGVIILAYLVLFGRKKKGH